MDKGGQSKLFEVFISRLDVFDDRIRLGLRNAPLETWNREETGKRRKKDEDGVVDELSFCVRNWLPERPTPRTHSEKYPRIVLRSGSEFYTPRNLDALKSPMYCVTTCWAPVTVKPSEIEALFLPRTDPPDIGSQSAGPLHHSAPSKALDPYSHALSGVETVARRLAGARRGKSFNGATPFQAWRLFCVIFFNRVTWRSPCNTHIRNIL